MSPPPRLHSKCMAAIGARDDARREWWNAVHQPAAVLRLLDALERAEDALRLILSQLEHSDNYAKAENKDPLPSVWEIQNSHLRDYARAGLRRHAP